MTYEGPLASGYPTTVQLSRRSSQKQGYNLVWILEKKKDVWGADGANIFISAIRPETSKTATVGGDETCGFYMSRWRMDTNY